MVTLAGLDGTKAGWIAALRDGPSGKVRVEAVGPFLPWAKQLPPGSVVGIDIPMGLEKRTIAGGRSCERATRALLGRGKSSSIFSTPCRRAVYAETWEEACRIVQSELPDRQGISKQAWNIFPKVREIDAARPKRLPIDMREAHPEVAFLTLNGGKAVLASKKSEAGRKARIALLKKVGLVVTPFLSQRPPGCAVDDLIDSFACLWVAGRIHSGAAVGYGDAPLTQIWA